MFVKVLFWNNQYSWCAHCLVQSRGQGARDYTPAFMKTWVLVRKVMHR